jgi:hypothetical protein
MLARLEGDQVSRGWKDVKVALESSVPIMPGESQAKYNNILTALLDGTMQCWVSWDYVEDGVKISLLVITQLLTDPFAETKSCLIYCVYSTGTPRKEWVESMESFFKWCRAQGCTKVLGYSNVPSILKHAYEWGCDVRGFVTYTL